MPIAPDVIAEQRKPLLALAEFQLDELKKNVEHVQFNAFWPDMESLVLLGRLFARLPVDGISEGVFKAVSEYASKAVALMNQVKTFQTVNNNQWPQLRDRIGSELRQAQQYLYGQAGTFVALSIASSNILDELKAQADRAITDLRQEQQKVRDDIQKLVAETKGQLKEIVGAAENAALEVGVTRQATHFQELAEKNRKEFMRWASAVLGSALLVVAFVSFISFGAWKLERGADVPEIVSQTSAKLLLFSVLVFVLTWSARNYRAARHNHAMNVHRATALATFSAFVAATRDEETKSTVLIQATKAIFEPQSSGYLTHEPDPFPQTTIVEIMRQLGSRGPPS